MVYRYYSVLRPIGPGTFPKAGMIEFENFNSRIPVKEIDRMAWGYLDYDRRLSGREVDAYDLVYVGKIQEDDP